MEKNIEETLQEILTYQEFDRLAPFKESDSWQQMSSSERDLLGLLFVAQGESLLKKGDSKATDSFDIASKIAPKNLLVFYRQAMAYASQDHNMRSLDVACKTLQKVVTLDPTFFNAWYSWGNILVRMGTFHGETTYFHEAHLKFLEADKHSNSIDYNQLADCYWQWGLCWHFMGNLSGEACDFHVALEKYRLAAEHGLQAIDFWKDYGDALVELSILIGRKEFLFEAIDLYRNVIRTAPDSFHGWYSLGRCYQRIFEFTHDQNYFSFAHDSFFHASEINPRIADLWMYWGQLFTDLGKNNYDLNLLEISLEKYKKADACEPNNYMILCRWGESLMLCGAQTESGDLLRGAEAKIVRSLEIHRENPEAWYLYGTCLNELGEYFSEESYYFQAIEKFRYGLTFNENDSMLWYGLALSHYAIGELLSEFEMVEKANQCFERVMEEGGGLFPQFWNDWGVALLKLAEMNNDPQYVEAAIAKFECAINQNSEDPIHHECDLEWLYNYGCAFDFLGDFTEDVSDYERAVQILSRVLEQDPTYAFARYNLALSLCHLGEHSDDVECFQKSSDHFEELLTQNPEDEMSWNDWGLTLMKHAQLVYDPLHPQQAEQLYEQAERKLMHATALGCTRAFYNLACLHALMGNFTVAMHYIQRANEADVLPSIDDLLHDPWLKAIRDTQEFRNYISLLSNKNKF